MDLEVLSSPGKKWPVTDKATHAAAVRAIAQAAVNVELFTIPLYMGTLYSIQGTHQITGKNNFYEGRTWPGLAPSAKPAAELTPNERAFNVIFSVFIDEMLHLQMAANIATAIGVVPTFTSDALQKPDRSWKCYGKDETFIPHIVDLKDTESYKHVKVKIDDLNLDQLDLFIAIEQPEEDARGELDEYLEVYSSERKYFPSVPFAGWTPTKTEGDLPLFGTIGWMYQCYLDYLKLEYKDNTTLWDFVASPSPSVQRDMFNYESKPKHPLREFQGFDATVAKSSGSKAAFAEVVDMMFAITDQGEGELLKDRPLMAVEDRYQPDRHALEVDYPAFDDGGHELPPIQSPHASARFDNGDEDHYHRFLGLKKDLVPGGVVTWRTWLTRNRWTADDLKTKKGPDKDNGYRLPTTTAVADALNAMGDMAKTGQSDDNFRMMSQAAVGAIAGITTVLDDFWSKPNVEFPFPSMVGSGDRVSICWAVFGEPPDLTIGLSPIDKTKLYHACQGLDFDTPGADCAAVEVFHSCKGSNACHAQGGCGFVQLVTGGGQCKQSTMAANLGSDADAAPGVDPVFSAPSDNKCGGFGGCAVPISASQVFPGPVDPPTNPEEIGTMELFAFEGPDHKSKSLGPMTYRKGEKVHDVAYRAYQIVMKMGDVAGLKEAPEPNMRRLVFPPST